MFLTSCHSLKYLDWCVSPVLSSVNNLQVSSLPPVPFWRRKTVTMKVLICVRCASPVAGDTSLSRASHSPVTSLRSPASLGCGTAGRVIAASGACLPPWRQGTPGPLGHPTRLGGSWSRQWTYCSFLCSQWGQSCIRSHSLLKKTFSAAVSWPVSRQRSCCLPTSHRHNTLVDICVR